MYAPVRGFLTIIELSTYLGKDPDTLIRWAGIAAEGRAKGPFPAAFQVLDATLGKKNRRIWLSDLDSKWVADHEQWTALTTSRWPSTWPRKYSTEKFATRHND